MSPHATRAQVENALRAHFEAWNAKDRARWIGDDGRVARVQTYFSPPAGQPLDPYFMQKP